MLAVKLDIIDEHNKDNEAEAMTVLPFYITGPGHKFKLSMHYPTSTGRNDNSCT
jgi:peroxidase